MCAAGLTGTPTKWGDTSFACCTTQKPRCPHYSWMPILTACPKAFFRGIREFNSDGSHPRSARVRRQRTPDQLRSSVRSRGGQASIVRRRLGPPQAQRSGSAKLPRRRRRIAPRSGRRGRGRRSQHTPVQLLARRIKRGELIVSSAAEVVTGDGARVGAEGGRDLQHTG
jgi:hypothetical protein